MQLLRAEKVARIVRDILPLEVFGPPEGELLILGWGSTYGAIRSAVERLQEQGRKVSHAHLRHLNPFPANTGDVVRSYRRVLIPELNMGQLRMLIRSMFLVDAEGFNLMRGKPFQIGEILAKAEQVLGNL
jgi:2-oxoglutarate ferredoxin oxidoreductase subunit alpha